MNGWLSQCMYECMDEFMYECMDGWIDRWMCIWMDGRIWALVLGQVSTIIGLVLNGYLAGLDTPDSIVNKFSGCYKERKCIKWIANISYSTVWLRFVFISSKQHTPNISYHLKLSTSLHCISLQCTYSSYCSNSTFKLKLVFYI